MEGFTPILYTMKAVSIAESAITDAATEARVRLGRATDDLIMAKVREFPGSSTYEVAKALSTSVGRVDGAVRRLQKRGMIEVQRAYRDGRLAKELYPHNYPIDDYMKQEVHVH